MSSLFYDYDIKKCPICHNDMINHEFTYVPTECRNGCFYRFYHPSGTIIIKIFDEEFVHVSGYSLHKEKLHNEILDKIEYWKENDRYLLKILELS